MEIKVTMNIILFFLFSDWLFYGSPSSNGESVNVRLGTEGY